MKTRGRSLVWIICLILAGAIGVLWAINEAGPQPKEIKARLEARIEELNKIPAEEAIRKDALAEELLANEEYQHHAKALWLKVERAHRPLHDAAQLDRAAQREVAPYLARSRDFSRLGREDLQLLIGEGKTLIANYGQTRFGAALRKREQELTAKLESLPKLVEPQDILELQRNVIRPLSEGHFSDAKALIDELVKRPGAEVYRGKIEPLIASIQSKAAAAAVAMLENARMLLGRKEKPAALNMLDRAAPDFRAFPKETADIEALRRTITSR
jgi:hypothetical protein